MEKYEIEAQNREVIGKKVKALRRQLDTLFAEYVKHHRQIPNESLIAYEGLNNDVMRKMFYIAANILVSVEMKQNILRAQPAVKQLYAVIEILTNEINILKIE